MVACCAIVLDGVVVMVGCTAAALLTDCVSMGCCTVVILSTGGDSSCVDRIVGIAGDLSCRTSGGCCTAHLCCCLIGGIKFSTRVYFSSLISSSNFFFVDCALCIAGLYLIGGIDRALTI